MAIPVDRRRQRICSRFAIRIWERRPRFVADAFFSGINWILRADANTLVPLQARADEIFESNATPARCSG